MSENLWALPTKPGTVIAIGGWQLIKTIGFNGDGSKSWLLLPPTSGVVMRSMRRADVREGVLYDDDWVLAETEQEGGYMVISEPVSTPYGPRIISQHQSDILREAAETKLAIFRDLEEAGVKGSMPADHPLGIVCPNCSSPAGSKCSQPTDIGRKDVNWLHDSRVALAKELWGAGNG